ncbi:hypothetical protein BH23BAC3_BH23BAC3_33850 [soil metagenome]
MTIKEIRKQLETSDKPIAKSFHIGEKFKVLLFGFKKGMKLVDHKAKHPTKLLVLEGDLIYHKEKQDIRLKQYDEVDIPANLNHSLGALKDSLVLLTQG